MAIDELTESEVGRVELLIAQMALTIFGYEVVNEGGHIYYRVEIPQEVVESDTYRNVSV